MYADAAAGSCEQFNREMYIAPTLYSVLMEMNGITSDVSNPDRKKNCLLFP